MQFHYTIVPKMGRPDQVGLRLKCVSELHAEEIHRSLRQHFKVSRLMLSQFDPGYTHFVYVTATEKLLRESIPEIEALCRANSDRISAERAETEAKAAQDFKTWQAQFRKALKQLNADSPSPISSVPEFSLSRLEQQIAAGCTTEIEEILLRNLTLNNNNNLRSLIALYARTARNEQVVELCETQRSEVLALPVSGRLAEQIVSAYLQLYQQTRSPDLLRSATSIAQELLPELERLRQAEGVRRLLHQAIAPQEPPPIGISATLSEKLGQLIEIEPADRIPQLESLYQKHPKALNVLMALAASYAVVGNIERALELYQSVPVRTEDLQQRCAELLLETGRFTQAIDLLPDSENISPALAGLRGTALYHLGQKIQALLWLEKAWQGGDRQVLVLLPLARLWATNGNFERAAEAYEVLREAAVNKLTPEDYNNIVAIARAGGFGDISERQVLMEYERGLNNPEPDLDL